MRDDYSQFRDVGMEVAVVTMGTVKQARGFRDRHELPFPCLADPDRTAYRAFEVPRASIAQVSGPSVWGKGLKAVAQYGVGKPVGDPLQLHAAFVIAPGGKICFAHYPQFSADYPDHKAMLECENPPGAENPS